MDGEAPWWTVAGWRLRGWLRSWRAPATHFHHPDPDFTWGCGALQTLDDTVTVDATDVTCIHCQGAMQ